MTRRPDLDRHACGVFLDAVKEALTLPAPDTGGEAEFLLTSRQRARLVLDAVGMIKEHGPGPAEVLAAAAWLREEVAEVQPGQYKEHPLNH